MDQIITEQLISISKEETQPEFVGDKVPAAFLPPIILSEIYRGKSGKVLYPHTQKRRKLFSGR